MPRNLILAGGISHDFETSAPALADVLSRVGIQSTVTFDVEDAIAQLDRGSLDLFTPVLIRWTMTGPRFDDRRARFGLSLSAAHQSSISRYVDAGGRMLAMHAAVISFDDFAAWKDIVGARWIWGNSFHPPYGRVQAAFTGSDHPIVRDLPDFDLDDEVYSALDMATGIEPLMRLSTEGATDQPGLWARKVGKGRVVYDALGHDAASIKHPVHARLIGRSALWALGASEQEIVGT